MSVINITWEVAGCFKPPLLNKLQPDPGVLSFSLWILAVLAKTCGRNRGSVYKRQKGRGMSHRKLVEGDVER